MTRPSDILWPALGTLSILLDWKFVVPALGVPAFIVPTPEAVFGKLWTDRVLLLANTWPTALEAVLGFLLLNTVAVLLAVLFSYSRPVRAAYFPIVLFLNTIPVLALA